ncbi:MAG: hypothetical protein ACI9B9_002511 [Halioglobus sp.]|jgi:uncharacterized protein (DUF1499 family)
MKTETSNGKVTKWLGNLALLALIFLPVSVLMVRGGLWQQGLAIYALSCLTAAILLLVFVIILLLPRTAGKRRPVAMRSLMAVPGTLLLLSVATTGGDYPAIHDITTDVTNPPVFTQAPLLRHASANSLDINEETLQSQLQAYPDLAPLESPLAFEAAFAKAQQTAEALEWSISSSDPEKGLIEAIDTTAVMAFKDDIVIRVWRQESTSRIDLRSASRVGVSDMGANVKRIRRFIKRFKTE